MPSLKSQPAPTHTSTPHHPTLPEKARRRRESRPQTPRHAARRTRGGVGRAVPGRATWPAAVPRNGPWTRPGPVDRKTKGRFSEQVTGARLGGDTRTNGRSSEQGPVPRGPISLIPDKVETYLPVCLRLWDGFSTTTAALRSWKPGFLRLNTCNLLDHDEFR